MSYDLSVVMPSIHSETWRKIYDTLAESVGQYSYEIIFVGPCDLTEDMAEAKNVKCVQDWGCPIRCIQIGAAHADGKLMFIGCDDAWFVKGAFGEAIDLYYEKCKKQDGIIVKYTEGAGRPTYTKTHASDAYWTARFHPNLASLAGISPEYKWGSILMSNEYFKEIGGLDCEYQVMNHGMHDLAYRLQNNGSNLYFTSNFVLNLDWSPTGPGYEYMQHAANNTWKVLVSHYGTPTDRFKISFDNWKQSPEKWFRFTDPPPAIEIPPYVKKKKRRRK